MKKKSKRLQETEQYHAAFLKRMGVNTNRHIPIHPKEIPYYRESPLIPSMNTLQGTTTKSEPKVYSGERKLLGIATMHKSNMVPVFADKKEDAIEIAKMRRG